MLRCFQQPATTSAELSERLHQKVADEIEARRAAAEELGVIPVVALRNGQQVVHGSLLVFPDDDSDSAAAKMWRRESNTVLSVIQSLSFDNFERFGTAVLGELGCLEPMVTRRAGDQGIDFYGEVSIGGLRGEGLGGKGLMHSARTVILGQAKHYPNRNIGPKEVRELVGALSLARTSTFSRQGLDLLDKVVLRPNTPTLALLFTTGDFTAGARYLASEAGVVVCSGLQLAIFLADCQVGMKATGEGATFDEAVFHAWMNGQTVAEDKI